MLDRKASWQTTIGCRAERGRSSLVQGTCLRRGYSHCEQQGGALAFGDQMGDKGPLGPRDLFPHQWQGTGPAWILESAGQRQLTGDISQPGGARLQGHHEVPGLTPLR